jgi:ribosomal protein S9
MHYLFIPETGGPSVSLECQVKGGGIVGRDEAVQAGVSLILMGVWT